MRTFRLRTLMLLILVTGLVVGNYIRLARQLDPGHSYGFPHPAGQIVLLSLVGDAIALLAIGLAYGVVRLGWQSLAGARRPRP